MADTSRNPQFYTVGIPLLFFHAVDNPTDPQAVDVTALARAYNGIVDLDTGRVLNVENNDTCYSPTEILTNAYVGNLNSANIGGEIKSTEHVATVEGRKEVDKVVLIRRSLDYTVQFDEMNKQNMQRFFAAQSTVYPTSELLSAKGMAKGAQAAAADFLESPIEIVDNGLTVAGDNSAALESILTERLNQQGVEFTPHDVGGTPTYIGGVYYFLVGDRQRHGTIEAKLAPYRGKLLAGFFKYDAATRRMKLQAWPTGMNTAAYTYAATSFDPRVRVFKLAGAETVSGITTNDKVLDRLMAVSALSIAPWAFNASTPSSQSLEVELPTNVARGSVKVTIKGRKWNSVAGQWQEVTETLYDRPQGAEATNGSAPLYPDAASYFTDPLTTMVNYETGVVSIGAEADFVTDSTTNNLETQELAITVSAYELSAAGAMWTGMAWGRANDTMSTMRVNRGKPEVVGCALIVHQNNVGVSMLHLIPRCILRPDGSIDFAKDDWQRGGFVLSCVKDDAAYLPNLERRIKIPFGASITYRHRVSQ